MIILLMGLPGSGKSTLAEELAPRLNAIRLNADDVRAGVNKDLGFTPADRLEQARRMGEMARLLKRQGQTVIVDFVCPTPHTRLAFGEPDALIFVDRIEAGRFEDTNKMFVPPENYHYKVGLGASVEDDADAIIGAFGWHDWKAPTTLLVGRYQPWHDGHAKLREAAMEDGNQAVLGIRTTQYTSVKDPLSVEQVKSYLPEDAMTVTLPNITRIVYGRDVGYAIDQISLGDEVHAISATEKRKELGLG